MLGLKKQMMYNQANGILRVIRSLAMLVHVLPGIPSLAMHYMFYFAEKNGRRKRR